MRVSMLLAALLLLVACDDKSKQSVSGNSGTAVNAGGDANPTTCNPIFSGNLTNTTVKIECGPGIPPAALEKLEAYLTEQLRSSRNLNDLVDKQRQDIADWEKKFREQTQNLAEALALMPNDQLLQAAQQALQAGDLERAAQLREQRFQQWEEKATAKLAAEAFQVSKAYQLAFKPLQALTYLEKAHRYQPGDFDFGFAYALALQQQNQRQNAEVVYQTLLKATRAEVGKPGRVAMILNNLGLLVADDTRRRGEAAGYFQEALKICRALAQDNPAVYLPGVAATLDNLAALVADDTRLRGEAEGFYQEALKIRRELAQNNPAVYLPDVANTLYALGLAQLQWQNPQQARATLQEAADLLRPYAQQAPGVIGDKQASILYLLAQADSDATRACQAVEEALRIVQGEDLQALSSKAQAACRPDQPPANKPAAKRQR